MEQLQHVGKVLGGIKALMVLKYEISINKKQCYLLLHIFESAFETISEEIRKNLKLEERETKWKSLENPLKELHRIIKEGEIYIKSCLDFKDWWGKAISLHQNRDCVEFHIHNLFSCFTIIIEAIESCGEIYGVDQDDMQKRRLMLTRKYDQEWNDPKIFQWKYAKKYLVTREICGYITNVWKEDKCILLEKVRENSQVIMTRHEQKLADYLIKKLDGTDSTKGKLLPAWILHGAKDYSVKRRLGSMGGHHKEIFWLGMSFALRSFFGGINEHILNEISGILSLSHPNIVQYFCGFYDDERKEGYILIELMNECLANYVRDNSGQRKKASFSLLIAVDIMLQVARGMEYLHSKKIYHGDLTSSNVLLKTRNSSSEIYFHAKVTGFGLTSIKSYSSKNKIDQKGNDFIVWHAPEVHPPMNTNSTSKFTEKADVYSFGMLCFEILTGKTPFEEAHLQGDKMIQSIRAGGRPLFPNTSPKFLVNLIKKCWQEDPFQRPSFSSICRILRYMKKCLVINPDFGKVESISLSPLVDCCEIETEYSNKFISDECADLSPVTHIPFEMFSYKIFEKEKTTIGCCSKPWDWTIGIKEDGIWSDLGIDKRSIYSEVHEKRRMSKIGADQRSVCSESPSPEKSSQILSHQRSILSERLIKKADRGNVSKIIDNSRLDGSDSSQRKKTLCSTTPDQGLSVLKTNEKIDDTVQEMKSPKIANKQIKKSKGKQKSGLVRDKNDPYGVKMQARKMLTPIQSNDSELESISPENILEKKLNENLSDQRSSQNETINRKLLPKAKSMAALISNGHGRELCQMSSLGTEKASSSRSSPLRANSNLSKPPKASMINRFQGNYRDTKTPPWI